MDILAQLDEAPTLLFEIGFDLYLDGAAKEDVEDNPLLLAGWNAAYFADEETQEYADYQDEIAWIRMGC